MSRYLPDFAGLFCLTIFIIMLGTISDGLLRDGDTFWHIKAGSVILEQNSLITTDIFSHTAFGTPWTAHEWLSEIIMASIHSLAGLEGLLCFFLLITSITFWFLYKITEKYANSWITLLCLAVALAYSPSHMAARPHMFTWLLMVVTLYILTIDTKRMYWLPVMTVIWANLHGGFVIGLVLQALFIFGRILDNSLSNDDCWKSSFKTEIKPFLILLACLLAAGLNPFGYEILLFPLDVTKGVFSTMISEWKAPDLQAMWYFRYYLVAIVLVVSLARSALNWTDRLLIIFFFNASLTHIRHISLMFLALTPICAKVISQNLSSWRQRSPRPLKKPREEIVLSSKSGPILTIALAMILFALCIFDHGRSNFLRPEKIFKVELKDLEQLTSFLEKQPPDGKMFNDYTLGGYLLYALSPPPKVFIDGRADMYGEQILKDYNEISTSGSKRDKLLDEYEIDWIVFEKKSALVANLEESGEWRSTFNNEQYSVLTRIVTNKTTESED